MVLGITYKQQGNRSGALEELQKAVKLESEMPWALAARGRSELLTMPRGE
jgi:hypothetical protein